MISRDTLTNQLLPTRYWDARCMLRKELNLTDSIATTTDSWTSRTTDPFTTITAHYITPEWEMKSCVLATLRDERRKTAENCAEQLRSVYSDWGISEKVNFRNNDLRV